MKLLLIETCGAEASIALADTERPAPVVASIVMPGRTASERLLGHLRQAMTQQRWTLPDLTAIAVVLGPGSFTGLRVGLSVAKGLSEASGVPLLGVSRLAVLAAAASNSAIADEQAPESEVCAILDAGRGEFYCGRYLAADCHGESLLSLDQALALAQSAARTVACEAKVQQVFAEFASPGPMLLPEPSAAHILPLILKRLTDSAFDDAARIDANYLRTSDQQLFAKPSPGRNPADAAGSL